ncbi:MAG: AraC family transcriptional regulator [Bacteroidota bacterium]
MGFKLELDSDSFNGLTLATQVEDVKTNPVMGSKYNFELSIGQVNFREHALGSKSWRYGGMSFSKNLALIGEITDPRIEFYFSLGGLYQSQIESHPQTFSIPSYKFSISYTPNPSGKCFLLEDIHNRFFEMNIKVEDLIRLKLTSSRSYDLLVKSVLTNAPFSVSYEGVLMDGQIMKILDQIENPPVHQNFLSRYTDLKLEELILLALQRCDEHSYGDGSKITHRKLERLSRAVDFIKNNHYDFPSLDHISKAAMSCKSQLCADFRKVYGCSVMDYCMRVRMEHAEHMIKSSDMTIAEIAYQIGYRNPQHFTAAFKRHFDVLPSKLRL